MIRLQLAELTSGVSALSGRRLGSSLRSMGRTIRKSGTIAGVIVHAFGMWDKRRLEAEASTYGASLVTALYWVCWLLLAGVLLYLMV